MPIGGVSGCCGRGSSGEASGADAAGRGMAAWPVASGVAAVGWASGAGLLTGPSPVVSFWSSFIVSGPPSEPGRPGFSTRSIGYGRSVRQVRGRYDADKCCLWPQAPPETCVDRGEASLSVGQKTSGRPETVGLRPRWQRRPSPGRGAADAATSACSACSAPKAPSSASPRSPGWACTPRTSTRHS